MAILRRKYSPRVCSGQKRITMVFCIWQVTPVLGMLLDMQRRRQGSEGEEPWPRKVHLTYAVHHKEEAALLQRALIARAM